MSSFKKAMPSSKPKFLPHPYQVEAISHLLKHPASGLFYPPGLGKTATTLAAYKILQSKGVVDKMLIIAPLRVCYNVWPNEVKDWSDFGHLSVGVLHGPKKGKVLLEEHDIYVINPDGLRWLSEQKMKFDKAWMLVVDESTIAKNGTSKRSKLLHKMAKDFGRRLILTGTPAPNGLINLWSQIKILDQGERLGRYITAFRNRYFYPSGYMGYEYKLQDGAETRIYSAIEDIVLHKSQDELDLPPRLYNTIHTDLPVAAQKVYSDMKDHLVAELDTGDLAVAMNAAVATGKLKQIANGGLWSESEMVGVHNAKTEVVESLVNELDGHPLMVMYEYKHDLDRLLKAFPDTPYIGGGVSAKKVESILMDWNRGELPLLLLHPACLHPETEVLTEHRGWIKIVDVRDDELVHDGVEFVSHEGCRYAGVKEVIDCFGMLMTPDHKLLVDGVWKEARSVRDSESARREALFSVWNINEKSNIGEREVDAIPQQVRRCRESRTSSEEVKVSEKSQKSHVYDLVNCGPRNRFLIRNTDGEVFISHNSGGHGINAQKGGCQNVCWYSIPFDLELYDQANARVHRQGVKGSVTIHHIVAKDTIDVAIMQLLKRKGKVQDALLNYLLN